ncbi:hypothetical protein [Ruegeria atlantica]|uniref:hypothetical protein n=1 Tax=Ruegeria atlantica TaxID=81569 RepID=UPI00249505D5|nr:hypothetical protein [Ruegeria atlantica]
MTKTASYFYHVFGFPLVSDFELPELGSPNIAGADAQLPDHAVHITRGSVPTDLENGRKVEDFLEFNQTECTYSVKDVARYLISAGRRIVIQPAVGASMIDVRYYLFGTIFGALLHQRQLLPLHISAVETPNGILAFTGQSGAGKSTTAYEIFKKTGWRLLSDDVAVIDPTESNTLLHCGIFRQKLWKDTVERSGLQPETLTRDTTRAEKFHVFSPEYFVSEPRHLRKLVILDVADEPKLDMLGSSEAFTQVMNTIYRPDLARLFGDMSATMQNVANIANEIETFRFWRPWSVDRMSASIHYLVERFG